MTILTGSTNKVTANVTGRIVDFMPPEILQVFANTPEGMKTWQPGVDPAGNTLNELVAGQTYYAASSADVDVPAFAPDSDTVEANAISQTLRGETTDGAFAELPGIALPNYSTSIIQFSIVGRDGLGYVAAKQITLTVSVDSVGAVTVEDSADNYTFGDVNTDFDDDINKLIPKLQNTAPAFTGTTRWAVTAVITQVVYIGLLP